MPVAEPFVFYGAQSLGPSGSFPGEMFTGFPLTEVVDVTDMADWVTLGGTRKGQTPTPEQIALSRVNAARLYWCLHGVYLSGAGGMGQDSGDWAGLMLVQGGYSDAPEQPPIALQPFARANHNRGRIYTDWNLWVYLNLFGMFRSVHLRPCRMVANDEFVGFGVGGSSGALVLLTAIGGSLDTDGRVAAKYLNSWAAAPNPDWIDHSFDLRVIDDIPFIEQSFFPTVVAPGNGISWATASIDGFSWWEFPD